MAINANKLKSQEAKIKNFSDLLNELSSTDDKKKLLYAQIYENAVEDRTKAEMLYNSAYEKIEEDSGNHVIIGVALAKYLERAEKSNAQILELAKLIAKEEEVSRFNPDDILSQIGNK